METVDWQDLHQKEDSLNLYVDMFLILMFINFILFQVASK